MFVEFVVLVTRRGLAKLVDELAHRFVFSIHRFLSQTIETIDNVVLAFPTIESTIFLDEVPLTVAALQPFFLMLTPSDVPVVGEHQS